MDEEYHQQQSNNICSQNWWSTNNNTNNPSGQRSNISRYESGSGADDSLVQHDMNKVEMIRLEDSASVSNNSSSLMFLNTNLKMPGGTADPCSILSSGGDGGLLVDTNLQHMGLRLSSQEVDWDQALLGEGKADQSSFRSMLEEDHLISSSENFQPEIQWKPNKIFTTHGLESSLGRSGFSLDQPQLSSSIEEININIARHNLPGIYIENSSSMLHSLLAPNNNESQQQQGFFENRCMEDYTYGSENYGMKSNESQFIPPSSFSSDNKFSQFVRNSSPQKQQPFSSQNHLQFSNNATYWNASSARVVPDVMQHHYPSSTNSTFEEKPKNNVKEGNKDSSVAVKKSGIEASTKRPRNESSPSTLPPFKVKKEKMGDRITTLQQLVSPFGKTDTASVLFEAIEYIKILHEQVLVLTAPYMKNDAMMHQHHHQFLEKPSRDSEGTKQDLRSSGLCLVPLSSTFPVTHETSVDFWTPTYGGPLR